MLISAEHLSINFGSRQLLDDVDFYLNEGDKTGVIGINGTGKSTFLKVLAGWLQPDSGTIARKPNLQVSVLAQNPAPRCAPRSSIRQTSLCLTSRRTTWTPRWCSGWKTG